MKKAIIQRLFVSILLVLFTVSFLPKSFFHDLIADHTDAVSCSHPGKNASCVHQKGYACGFNDLVVSTHYIHSKGSLSILQAVVFSVENNTQYLSFNQQYFLAKEGRGPPRTMQCINSASS